jgi:predicted MFS family arabinose efflux permease
VSFLHDLWLLLWGNLAIATAVSFGRFAFAVLVPSMKASLGYGAPAIGWLGTANFAGYSAGALTAGTAERHFGRKPCTVLALGAIALTLFLMAGTSLYPAHLVLRFATGVASGWVSVLASTLILDRAPPNRAGLYLGVINGGAGVGIALSGILLPPFLRSAQDWRSGWLVLAALSLLVCAGFWASIRDPRVRRPPAAHRQASQAAAGQRHALVRVLGQPILVAAFLGYALFGFGYTATATFFVVFLQDEQGLGDAVANLAWTMAGLSAAVGPLAFGRLRDIWGSRHALVFTHLVIAGSILLLVGMATPVAAVGGGFLFGASFVGLVTIVIVLARESSPPEDAAYVIGAAIICLSIGQAAGPAVAGLVARLTGSLAGAFWLAAVACAAGAPLSVLARVAERRRPDSAPVS